MRGVEEIPWLYDLYLSVLEPLGLRRWRAWLVAGARGRTLDLGSGTGRNLPLLPPGARGVAVDPHPDALARARARAPGVPLVVARAEALPFRAGSFDTVVSGLVLCSVDDADAALAEVRRVLRPGGGLRLLEHVRHSGVRGALQDSRAAGLDRALRRLPPQPRDRGRRRPRRVRGRPRHPPRERIDATPRSPRPHRAGLRRGPRLTLGAALQVRNLLGEDATADERALVAFLRLTL